MARLDTRTDGVRYDVGLVDSAGREQMWPEYARQPAFLKDVGVDHMENTLPVVFPENRSSGSYEIAGFVIFANGVEVARGNINAPLICSPQMTVQFGVGQLSVGFANIPLLKNAMDHMNKTINDMIDKGFIDKAKAEDLDKWAKQLGIRRVG